MTFALAAALQWTPCGAGEIDGEPLRLRAGMAFVDVRINGNGPFRMLVDTGTAACMLTPEAAKKAGLVFDHRSTLATLAGDKIVPGDSKAQVQVGPTSESKVEVVVTDLTAVRTLDRKADGVLGGSFLKRAAFLIDFARKRLWLGNKASERAERLPLAIRALESDGRTILPVMLEPGGRAWRLTLDSGASNLVVQCGQGCPPVHDVRNDNRLVTFIGDRPIVQGLLRHVEVGGYSLPPMEAALAEGHSSDWGDEGVFPAKRFSAVYVNDKQVRLAVTR